MVPPHYLIAIRNLKADTSKSLFILYRYLSINPVLKNHNMKEDIDIQS
jgi:hypothetical protein